MQILMLIEVLKNSLEVESARLLSLFAVFALKAASLFLYLGIPTRGGMIQCLHYCVIPKLFNLRSNTVPVASIPIPPFELII